MVRSFVFFLSFHSVHASIPLHYNWMKRRERKIRNNNRKCIWFFVSFPLVYLQWTEGRNEWRKREINQRKEKQHNQILGVVSERLNWMKSTKKEEKERSVLSFHFITFFLFSSLLCLFSFLLYTVLVNLGYSLGVCCGPFVLN